MILNLLNQDNSISDIGLTFQLTLQLILQFFNMP